MAFVSRGMSADSNDVPDNPAADTLTRFKRDKSQLAEDDPSRGPCPGDPIVLLKEHNGVVVHYLSTVPRKTHDPERLMYSDDTFSTTAGCRTAWLHPDVLKQKNEDKDITVISGETVDSNFKEVCHPPPVKNGLFRIHPERTPISIEMEYVNKEMLRKGSNLTPSFKYKDKEGILCEEKRDAAWLLKEAFPAGTGKYEHRQSFNLLDWITDAPWQLKSDASSSSSSSSSDKGGKDAVAGGFLARKKKAPATDDTKFLLAHSLFANFHCSDTSVNMEIVVATPSCLDENKIIEWATYRGYTENLEHWNEHTPTTTTTNHRMQMREMYPLITKHSADRSAGKDGNVMRLFDPEDSIWLHEELSWWLSINPAELHAHTIDPNVETGFIKVEGVNIAVRWYDVVDDMKAQSFPVWLWMTRRTEVVKDYCAACKFVSTHAFVDAFGNKYDKETKKTLMPIPTTLMEYLIGRVYTEFDMEKLFIPVRSNRKDKDFHVITKLPKGPFDVERVKNLYRQPNVQFSTNLEYQSFDQPTWKLSDTKVREAVATFKGWGMWLETLQKVAENQSA
jgi:hypothetical protein